MASLRTRPAILKSTQSSLLNSKMLKTEDEEERPQKKQRVDLISQVPLEPKGPVKRNIFTVRPCPTDTSPVLETSYTFETIALVPHSQLPLSWLNQSSAPGKPKGIPNQFFTAYIPPLERPLDECSDPCILVARLLPDEGFYIVEKVQPRLYAALRLKDFVQESDAVSLGDKYDSVESAWPASRPKKFEEEEDEEDEGLLDDDSWWKSVAGPIEPPSSSTLKRRNGESHKIKMRFRRTGHDNTPEIGQKLADPSSELSELQPEKLSSTSAAPDFNSNVLPESITQDPQETMEVLRNQYLDALYVSKTSVAYFAKGPLARARGSQVSPLDLAAFYRDSILPLKKMDHKYKESVPGAIRALPISKSDDENEASPRAASKKRKSRKKKKLGRNALWPEEDNYIKGWWHDRNPWEPASQAEETIEAELKRLVGHLRLRETQLQILLILETIALEATCREDTGCNLPTAEVLPKATKERKKPQDLKTLLDLLLDRLCIWQAVTFEDILSTDAKKDNSRAPGKKVENDALRDFCTEVIVPFYGARLPEQCKAINRKLGGPSTVSPVRRSVHKSSNTSQVTPGSAVARPQPTKQPRSLQRVLTDDKLISQSRSKAPTLSRSSTAPDIKRDSREPSLPPRVSSRGGIQKVKRVDNREVDLNAVAKQHENKIKRINRMVDQKRELLEAIQTIRKPNRGLVSKELAVETEKRVSATLTSSSRKKREPVRNALGQGAEIVKGVQVMATPRKSRRVDAFASSRGGLDMPSVPSMFVRSPSPANARRATAMDAFGSDALIPSSAIRPAKPDSGLRTFQKSANMNTIHETPSRGSSKISDPLGMMVQDAISLQAASRLPHPSLRSKSLPDNTTPTKHRSLDAIQDTPLPAAPHLSTYLTPNTRKPRRGTLFPAVQSATPTAAQAGTLSTHPFQTPVKPTSNPWTSTTPITTTPILKVPLPTYPITHSANIPSSPPVPVSRSTDKEEDDGDIYGALGWDNDDDIDELA